jgi:hypothetical protein
MADYPPLDKAFVAGYRYDDPAYPLVHIKKDPRITGYKVPSLGSACPDVRQFPNHTFTGTLRSEENDAVVIWTYENIPSSIPAGLEVSSQFGGGVLETTEQVVDPGTTIDGGLKVVSAAVQPDGKGKSIKQTKTLPDGEEWPTLREPEFVPQLNEFIDSYKTVVENTDQAGTKTGGANPDDLEVTEYQPIDKWKTIQIVSKVPWELIDADPPITFHKTINFNFPNEIIETPVVVKAFRALYPTNDLATPGTGSTLLEFINSRMLSDFGFDYSLVEGYSGPVNCEVTRTISLSSSVGVTPITFSPRSERIVVAIDGNYLLGQTDGGVQQGFSGKVLEFTTPSALHGEWDIEIADNWSLGGYEVWDNSVETPTFNIYTPTTDPTDSEWFRSHFDMSPAARVGITYSPHYVNQTINVSRPATIPETLEREEPIIIAVNSEEWRFGLWVHDVYRCTVPPAFPEP